jgi:hypothetical protein
MDIKTILDIIANQGFPIALSILLIFRIDRFMQEIVTAQKEGYRQILENTKDQRDTQYAHQLKPAKSRVLLSSLFGSAERISRSKGRVGLAPLNSRVYMGARSVK